jgi:ribosomal protein S4E
VHKVGFITCRYRDAARSTEYKILVDIKKKYRIKKSDLNEANQRRPKLKLKQTARNKNGQFHCVLRLLQNKDVT